MRKRILVVDDDPAITKIMGMILRSVDWFDVETTNDPLEGYARMFLREYDLLILDVQMPLAGDTLSECITSAVAEGLLPKQPKIVLISGALKNETLIGMSQAMSAATFLMKPFHPATLQQIVSTVLELPVVADRQGTVAA